MNRSIAYKCLEIDEQVVDLSVEELKRKYKIKALLYHPDRNKSKDAVSKFQEIQNAYEFLLNGKNDDEDDYDFTSEEYFNNHPKIKYLSLLFSFLKNVFKDENRMNLMKTIMGIITTACEETILSNLEKLDKNVLIKIYDIVNKYKDILHIETDIINKIEQFIITKGKNEEIIILNPLIDDLIENNLYKMTINNNTFIIPLWHHELVYDNKGADIIVKCIPILPENVSIDENNNIHLFVSYKIEDIWKLKYTNVFLGKNIYTIEIELLKLTEEQTVLFAKQGISKINTAEVYDVSKLSDVYIHIKLML